MNAEQLKNMICSNLKKILAGILFACIMLLNDINACSVFCIDKKGFLVTGRSYDWSFGEALVIINKRGHRKTALRYYSESGNNLAQWVSKYGSVTFVQYGRDIAFDGMNEAGLYVGELWLEESGYPDPDLRASLSLDQYVQYILDNFKTVDEIPACDSLIRLRPTPGNFTKIHFFAADSSGNCMVIEFIEGRMIYHTKESMTVKVITNSTYENSINYYNSGIPPSPGSSGSLARFYRIADMIKAFDKNDIEETIGYTFEILNAVKAGTWTKFQTVFDIKNRIVYFKSLQNFNLRFFDFHAFDFTCETESKMLDVNEPISGDVTNNFIPYCFEVNEDLIHNAWADLGSTDVYLPALQIISRYPETFECTGISGIHAGNTDTFEKTLLYQNFPNPFRSTTTIHYFINKPSDISLLIYDAYGRIVKMLENSDKASGDYYSVWDNMNKDGKIVAVGIYIYCLRTDYGVIKKKMIRL